VASWCGGWSDAAEGAGAGVPSGGGGSQGRKGVVNATKYKGVGVGIVGGGASAC
jgi:hypothetical protein